MEGAAQQRPADAHRPALAPNAEATFDELGLDTRIRRALTRMRWARPTVTAAHRVAMEARRARLERALARGRSTAAQHVCARACAVPRARSPEVQTGWDR